jgi:hypothetical protein
MKLGSDTIFEAFCHAVFFKVFNGTSIKNLHKRGQLQNIFTGKEECHLQAVDKYYRY